MRADIDPGNWGLKGKDAYDRRCYFWNLLQGDMWQVSTGSAVYWPSSKICSQSLGTGRPPALADLYSNCKVPTELEEREYQQHEHAALGCESFWFMVASQL